MIYETEIEIIICMDVYSLYFLQKENTPEGIKYMSEHEKQIDKIGYKEALKSLHHLIKLIENNHKLTPRLW